MRSKRQFTQESADSIRSLLGRTRQSERSLQKRFRAQIREIGFYISDFARPATGFRPIDFDELVRRRVITILRSKARR
jgi:hypothetical protein